jgi:lysozyme
MELNEQAVKIAVKIISNAEGCILHSYPDPASPLYSALSTHGMLHKMMKGQLKWKDLPDNFKALKGSPWTLGHGETKDIKPDMEWSLEQAKTALEDRVREFMEEVLKVSPELVDESPQKIAAVTSLCYNIGLTNYKSSTVAKKIANKDFRAAADAFLMWNKAQGKILSGLVTRREIEKNLFLSV